MIATFVRWLSRLGRRAVALWSDAAVLFGLLLIDRGNGLIYDVERDVTWLQDVNYAKTSGRSPDGQMTWDAATAWVAQLNYRGITGWRLPTARNRDGSGPCIGNDCRDSEFGHLFFTAVNRKSPGLQVLNFEPYSIFWTSTEASPTEAHAFKLVGLRQGTLVKDPWAPVMGGPPIPLTDAVRVWPVHDGDVARRWYVRLFALIGLLIRRS
jgi:hypothetical protein